MLKFQREPELRFEESYNDLVTVLEGQELGELNRLFFKHFRQQKGAEFMDAFLASVLGAYSELYGDNIVAEEELQELVKADARKLNLFYRGMYRIMCEALYPDKDWDELLAEEPPPLEIVN